MTKAAEKQILEAVSPFLELSEPYQNVWVVKDLEGLVKTIYQITNQRMS